MSPVAARRRALPAGSQVIIYPGKVAATGEQDGDDLLSVITLVGYLMP